MEKWGKYEVWALELAQFEETVAAAEKQNGKSGQIAVFIDLSKIIAGEDIDSLS